MYQRTKQCIQRVNILKVNSLKMKKTTFIFEPFFSEWIVNVKYYKSIENIVPKLTISQKIRCFIKFDVKWLPSCLWLQLPPAPCIWKTVCSCLALDCIINCQQMDDGQTKLSKTFFVVQRCWTSFYWKYCSKVNNFPKD